MIEGRRPRVGVITFPGSLDDRDAVRAVGFMGGEGWRSGTPNATCTALTP